jgi:hypothetical protein
MLMSVTLCHDRDCTKDFKKPVGTGNVLIPAVSEHLLLFCTTQPCIPLWRVCTCTLPVTELAAAQVAASTLIIHPSVECWHSV